MKTEEGPAMLAQQRWRNATRGVEMDIRSEELRAFIDAVKPQGARVMGFDAKLYNDGGSIEIRRSFAVDATLYVRLGGMFGEGERVVNPDKPNETVTQVVCEVEVSWSGTTRSLAAAVASLAVYRDLVELGAQIKAFMDQGRVYRLHVRKEA